MLLSRCLRSSFDVVASVVLTRSPLIAPPMSEVEMRFHRLQMQEEMEKSLLNDYELKTRKDEKLLARRAELEAAGKDLSELEGEMGVTNAMREDEWAKKAREMTQSLQLDKSYSLQEDNDQSLRRKIDRKLVLVVKQKFGKDKYVSPWIVPQIEHRQGETLRQTAERCVGEVAKGDLSVSLYGNAPFSVYTHRYPKPLAKEKGKEGAKIFFYNAVLDQKADFQVNKDEIVDFKWTTEEEFFSTVPGKKYKGALKNVFLE